jgi:omega-6 fatty acid desaturase (delta-12 desaturase)
LAAMNRFTARATIGNLRLALWDEDRRRLVSFSEAARTCDLGLSRSRP